jgi:pyruvate/2-oxoacid:ferredoxin oxidoreductase alpha subunit
VFAPNSVQEMADLTALAFEMADRYRNPVVLMADGYIGQMMEAVEFPKTAVQPQAPSWAVMGTPETRRNLIHSIRLDQDELEAHNRALEAKYREAERTEVRAEEFETADAEIVLVGYGIVARILKAVTHQARSEGLRVGLLRPITLYPFPGTELQRLARHARMFLVVEMSNGQMVDDVRLAVEGVKPVEFYGRMGGNTPSSDEVMAVLRGQERRFHG